MRLFQVTRTLRIFGGSESGVSLIETLVALAILSAVAVAFLSGLATTSRAVMISQERVVAESLAKSQLEYIKAQDYTPTADYALIDIPSDLLAGGYEIEINPEIISSPGENGFGLQSITVVVRRNSEEMLTVSDYKTGRVT